MARGGFRLGAGRPKGTQAQKLVANNKSRPKHAGKRLTPLEYMLSVINDPEADAGRRDRMAIAAAPYIHGRPSSERPGKKEQAARDAETAGEGTGWEDLIGPRTRGLS